MDEDNTARRLSDRGVSSVQFLLASALALLMFVAFANLVAVQYGRGALRSALEQGVRAGAITSSASDCQAVSMDVIGQLLGGRMSDDVVVRCAVSGGLMTGSASVVFESWSPLTPDFPVSMTADAVVEGGP